MPHLSPMNWIIFSLMFWTLILVVAMLIWWNPKISSKTTFTIKKLTNTQLPW